jgi:hypothetical protein
MKYTLCMYNDCNNLTTDILEEYGTYCFQHTQYTNDPIKYKKSNISNITPVTISMGSMNKPFESSIIYSSSKPERKVKSVKLKVPFILNKKDEMECCVCEDMMNIDNKMNCGHLVCDDCLDHIRTMKCPICKEMMEGPLLKDEVVEEIMLRNKEDIEERGMEDDSVALIASMGYNPNNFY